MNSSIPNNGFSQTSIPPTALPPSTRKFRCCARFQRRGRQPGPDLSLGSNYTLNYPRFALSDGTRLFIAMEATTASSSISPSPHKTPRGGHDSRPDRRQVDQATDAADSMNTPTTMAFDGTNLYVADPYNRRITVYTVAPNILPYQAVVNEYNTNIYATGTITVAGTINNGDVITVTIGNAAPYTANGSATFIRTP